jgi:hypothetical protein
VSIKAVVFVRDYRMPLDRTVVTGEVPGPWATETEAVAEALYEGQRYRLSGDVILAQDMGRIQ